MSQQLGPFANQSTLPVMQMLGVEQQPYDFAAAGGNERGAPSYHAPPVGLPTPSKQATGPRSSRGGVTQGAATDAAVEAVEGCSFGFSLPSPVTAPRFSIQVGGGADGSTLRPSLGGVAEAWQAHPTNLPTATELQQFPLAGRYPSDGQFAYDADREEMELLESAAAAAREVILPLSKQRLAGWLIKQLFLSPFHSTFPVLSGCVTGSRSLQLTNAAPQSPWAGVARDFRRQELLHRQQGHLPPDATLQHNLQPLQLTHHASVPNDVAAQHLIEQRLHQQHQRQHQRQLHSLAEGAEWHPLQQRQLQQGSGRGIAEGFAGGLGRDDVPLFVGGPFNRQGQGIARQRPAVGTPAGAMPADTAAPAGILPTEDQWEIPSFVALRGAVL